MLLPLQNVRSILVSSIRVWIPIRTSVCTDFFSHSELTVVEEHDGDPHMTKGSDVETPDEPTKGKLFDLLKDILDKKSSLFSDGSNPDSIKKAIFGKARSDSINSTLDSSCASNWTAPWQVGLMIFTSDDTSSPKLCGGVLIHPRWVLTAAHCLANKTATLAMVGSRNYYEGFFNGEGQRLSVEKSIVHERYRPNTESRPPLHDIALLKLGSDVVLGPDVSPARIPKRNSSPLSNDTDSILSNDTDSILSNDTDSILSNDTDSEMMISGWGANEKTHTSQEHLHCARVPLVSLQDCQSKYQQLGVSGIRSSHVCAGYPSGGVGPCNGDSGGGLVQRRSDGNSTVIGIISWSLGCGKNHGVYTSVEKHRSWILTNVPELAIKTKTKLM